MRDLAGLLLTILLSVSFAQAKPDFKTRKIRLAGKTLTVEVADTPSKREHGLMFRESLPKDGGMLFIFDEERTLSFWMLNTLIPLSIGYFDQDRKLVDIQEMVPAVAGEKNPKTYPSKEPARYALEMKEGWFKANNIKTGAVFTFVDAK